MTDGCVFEYALSSTPILTSTSPASGNEGDTLTVKGHAFSLVASENYVTVGGEACAIVSVTQDGAYTPAPCPATSCTLEMQTLVVITCTLPSQDAFQPHAIDAGVKRRGDSPLLASATITYSSQLRSFSPSRGSLMGGTVVTLVGDGLSNRLADIDVSIGGVRCAIYAASVSRVSCVTGAAAQTSSSVVAAVLLSVRSAAVTCTASPCTFIHATDRTPKLTSASVVDSSNDTQWTSKIDGDLFQIPSDQGWLAATNTIMIGRTPCTPIAQSKTQITCVSAPPLSGDQLVTLTNEMGSALGVPSMPIIKGIDLTLGGISPANVSLAGGVELTVSGAGFSAASSRVSVCERDCKVTSVKALALTCTIPSLLLHASGQHHLNLTNVTEAELDLQDLTSAPPQSAYEKPMDTITIHHGKVVAMRFDGLNNSALPRGSELSSVVLRVIPHMGASGAVATEIRASLDCSHGPPPLSASELAMYNQTNETVEWDMQPYDLGFESDESPNLARLVRNALSSSTTVEGCALVLLLYAKPDSPGVRTFYSAASSTLGPELRIRYAPPTTAAQVGWTRDKPCPVTVAVPTTTGESFTCDTPVDAAASRAVADTNTCAHLRLEATAATSGVSPKPCALSVNGLDLMNGCGLNKIVVGRDGVCAVVVDPPNKPRAACFDTKTQGQGAEQLASWIDSLPVGASVMLASCSRLSWAHDRDSLATSLSAIGTQSPPTRLDDAFAIIGLKGTTSALAEAKTQCCENPDPVCHTCDQTVASAAADVACGAAVLAGASALDSTGYLGPFASAGFQAAVGAVAGTTGSLATTNAGTGPASMAGVFSHLQADDGEKLDAACDTPLANDVSVHHGALLATDGDASTYWLSVGREDAVLMLDLGMPRLVRSLVFTWRYPASSLIVLYSEVAIGSSWQLGGSVHQAASPPTSISMPGQGVLARRLRLYMADAANASWPVFGISELVVTSCAQPEVSAVAENLLWYSRHSTPMVRSVSPRRGSTAGGTLLTLVVENMPSAVADISVTVVGTPCAFTHAAEGEVHCVTGSYGVTTRLNSGAGFVHLVVAGTGTAASMADAHYEYIDLWR